MNGFEHYTPAPGISVSSLDTYARCPRRYFYSMGVRIGTEEHPALRFGEAIHAALPLAFFGDAEASFNKFDEVFGDTPQDEKRNPISARKMIIDYMNTHCQGKSLYNLLPPPAGAYKASDRVSEYEIPFVLDIGLPLPLIGRVDALCEHRDSKELWVLEWKTASEMSQRFFDGFTFSPQLVCYTMVLRAMGVPVRGAMLEAIGVSKTKNQNSSQPFFISDSMVEDFLLWAKRLGTQILSDEQSQSFPKSPSGCNPYSMFGQPGYTCEFQPLCLDTDWTRLKGMFSPKRYPTFQLLELTINNQKQGG